MKMGPVTLKTAQLLFQTQSSVCKLGFVGSAHFTAAELRRCPETQNVLPSLGIDTIESGVPGFWNVDPTNLCILCGVLQKETCHYTRPRCET